MYLDDSEKQKIPAGQTLQQDLIFTTDHFC